MQRLLWSVVLICSVGLSFFPDLGLCRLPLVCLGFASFFYADCSTSPQNTGTDQEERWWIPAEKWRVGSGLCCAQAIFFCPCFLDTDRLTFPFKSCFHVPWKQTRKRSGLKWGQHLIAVLIKVYTALWTHLKNQMATSPPCARMGLWWADKFWVNCDEYNHKHRETM